MNKIKQNNKIFGFDIDGVLTYEGQGNNNIWVKYLQKFLGEKIEIKNNSYDFCEAFELSQETLNEFLDKHLEEIYASVPRAPKADEVLSKLKSENYYIVLITARDKEFRNLTEKWLKKHNIIYDKLFHESNKAKIADKMGLELFVDDKKENIIELNKVGIPTLVFDSHHNKDLNQEHYFERVNNWEQIQEIINESFI